MRLKRLVAMSSKILISLRNKQVVKTLVLIAMIAVMSGSVFAEAELSKMGQLTFQYMTSQMAAIQQTKKNQRIKQIQRLIPFYEQHYSEYRKSYRKGEAVISDGIRIRYVADTLNLVDWEELAKLKDQELQKKCDFYRTQLIVYFNPQGNKETVSVQDHPKGAQFTRLLLDLVCTEK